MKKINFLNKLKEEEKIKIAEPSDNLMNSYIKKSRSSLKSAKILLENGQIEDSVPMAYYSMYNMLTALFNKVGIACENHSASIIILKELFEIDSTKISFAKKERVDKQYYVDFNVTKEEVEKLIRAAEEFNPMLHDFIEKLTTKKAEAYLVEFKEALGIS
jgi:uncharacterized protein (UPF0332 family)